ncbi:MAG: hypothetical protein Q8R48_05755, partial [Candidatus Omnitrophota bacterium]|nr:hypothetical protein [Candidatus Omnitrophota bacterium]
KIDISNDKGEIVQTISMKSTLIAPNTKKEMPAKAETALTAGKYKAKAIIMFGGKEMTKEGEFSIR